MGRNEGAVMHRNQGRSIVIVLALVLGLAAASEAQDGVEVGVRYRSQDTIYLDNGTRAGLAEGDRLEVWRGGERCLKEQPAL